MSEEKQTALSVTTDTALSTAQPALKGAALIASRSGMTLEEYREVQSAIAENTDDSEIQYSRLALLQPQSPEITQEIPGYKMGMIVDNLNREVLSTEDLPPWLLSRGVPASELKKVHYTLVVPVFKLPSEFIHWKDRNTEGTGFHWKVLDASDPRVKAGLWPPRGHWQPDPSGKGKKSPPVTENCNILEMCLDAEGNPVSSFVVNTFARTSFNTGKKLITACEQHSLSNLPFWGRCYWLYTSKRQEGSNTWYEFAFAKGPKLADVNQELNGFIAKMALKLAKSKEFQERLINLAFLDEATDTSDTTTDATSTSTASDTKEEDPFT